MIVHRLDRDTSGVLLLARNDDALKQLHNDFKNKARVKKTYVALVCGHWTGQSSRSCVARDEGEIDLPLVRDIERPPFMRVATAETEERLPVTRLELHPITGRTHQLRVHCAAMGHPIVGDSIYGFCGEGAPHGGLSNAKEECMLCLHAQQLNVFHPYTNAPMSFSSRSPF
ncbi:RNA pseudouridine synthase, RluA family [Skeletonema marinoi]|uniref:RNA pseudouridine synthase, RluA family n=1 Tax=Skeletonema marinoi TaxID=267567 RepID=A0AAD8Y385_9STRA|nr:RNA pseudouridine synthase, RluA family [Skeletonema marinoi]